MRRPWLLALLALLTLGCKPTLEKTHMEDPRTAEFKALIQFDRLAPAAGDTLGVCLEWPDPATLGPLPGGGWTSKPGSVVLDTPGMAQRTWALKQGEATIKVGVYVSSTGAQGARDRLVKIATNTMMRPVPFQPAPQRLGELAVLMRGADRQHLVWVFHNVCAQVEVFGAEPDAGAIAASLETRMDKAAAAGWQLRAPKLAGVKASRDSVRVGESFSVDLAAAPGTDLSVLVLRAFETPPGERLGLTASSKHSATFQALAEGDATVDVAVADPKTLLSAWARVKVHVGPR